MDNEVIFGICDMCKEEEILSTTQFVYSIECKCCDPSHYEEVQHCGTCIPEAPEFISYISKSGVEMIDVESSIFMYMHGN
jgi:hypothetical protein